MTKNGIVTSEDFKKEKKKKKKKDKNGKEIEESTEGKFDLTTIFNDDEATGSTKTGSLGELFANDDEERNISLEFLFQHPDRRMITDLDQEQIVAVTQAIIVGDYYDCKTLKQFTHNYITLHISKDRKGREEVVRLQTMENDSEMEEKKGFFKRLIGW